MMNHVPVAKFAVCERLMSDENKRGAPRRRVLKGAVVASNDRRSTLRCTVRDLSATGARLEVRGSVTVPDTFLLIIELDGLEAHCEVVRRKGLEIAV
jgi:hypothetical protein